MQATCTYDKAPPAGGLVDVQQRGAGQQLLHVAQELLLQPPRRPTADPGQKPGGDIDRGQRLQQVAGTADRQVVRAREQRRPRADLGTEPHRRARDGHGIGVLDRHRLVIPARGGDRPATPAHLRDPLVLGDLRRRRRSHIDNLTALTTRLLRPCRRTITAPAAIRPDLQPLIGIVTETA